MATSANAIGVDCPECGTESATGGTEAVCPECGVVVEDSPIDHGPEWRTFDDRDNPARASPGDRDLHDRGLGSEVGTAPERSGRDHRLQTWNKRVSTERKKDRNRGYATTEIQRLASALDLGESLTKQAKTLFRQVHERDLLPGRDMDTVTAACVYAVCRIHQRGILPADVAEVARTSEKLLTRRYNWLNEELGLEVPPPNPETRIRVVGTTLGADDQTVKRALYLCERMDDCERHRGKPSTVAAACLYRASEFTQSDCAEAAGVTPAALRNRLDGVKSVSVL